MAQSLTVAVTPVSRAWIFTCTIDSTVYEGELKLDSFDRTSQGYKLLEACPTVMVDSLKHESEAKQVDDTVMVKFNIMHVNIPVLVTLKKGLSKVEDLQCQIDKLFVSVNHLTRLDVVHYYPNKESFKIAPDKLLRFALDCYPDLRYEEYKTWLDDQGHAVHAAFMSRVHQISLMFPDWDDGESSAAGGYINGCWDVKRHTVPQGVNVSMCVSKSGRPFWISRSPVAPMSNDLKYKLRLE